MEKMRILILRGGAIGDFIVTLPALQAVRNRWPEAYIELVGYPHIARLAEAGGLVDRVASLDSAEIARLFSLAPDIPAGQAEYIRSFNLIISYLYDPDDTVRRNMLAVGACHVVCGSPRVESGHAVQCMMKPLESLAIYPEGELTPRLTLSPPQREQGKARVAEIGERVIAIHPGSGSPRKNWPAAHFLQLAARLEANAGVRPCIILGEADEDIGSMLERKGCRLPKITGCSLVELAGHLLACRAYVGNDSGITHLAAALGIPVVALFGPSNPDAWAPRGSHVRVVRALEATPESLAEISVAQVFEQLSAIS